MLSENGSGVMAVCFAERYLLVAAMTAESQKSNHYRVNIQYITVIGAASGDMLLYVFLGKAGHVYLDKNCLIRATACSRTSKSAV